MTATFTVPAATSTMDVPPATRLRRKAMALGAIAGGLLTAAGFVATVWEADDSKLAYLNSLDVDPLRSQIAAVLLHFGYIGFVPVLLALAIMTRRRAVLAGNIGLGLGLVGAIALPGLLVTDFYDLAIRQNLPDAQAVAVSDAAQALPLATLIGGPFILLMFVGMVVASLAAWRAGFFHWAPALLLVAGNAVMFVVPMGQMQCISGAFLGLFMVTVGVAAFRVTDQEWVSGVRGAGR